MLRLMAGMSQDELARQAGVSRFDVSRLERNYHSSARVRAAIALVLGVPVEALGRDPKDCRNE